MYDRWTEMGFSPRTSRAVAGHRLFDFVAEVEEGLVGTSAVQASQVPVAANAVLGCIGVASGPAEGASHGGTLEYLRPRFSSLGVCQDRPLLNRRLHLARRLAQPSRRPGAPEAYKSTATRGIGGLWDVVDPGAMAEKSANACLWLSAALGPVLAAPCWLLTRRRLWSDKSAA